MATVTTVSQGDVVEGSHHQRISAPLFWLLTVVTVFLYFEVQWQVWFLKLLNGYLIKVWLPPFALFWMLVLQKLVAGKTTFTVVLNRTLIVSLFLYTVFGFASLAMNEAPYFMVKYYLIMVTPVILFMVVVSYFRDNADIEKLLKILFICGLIQAVYSFYAFESWLAEGQPVREVVVTSRGNVIGAQGTDQYYSSVDQARVARFSDFSFEPGRFAAILFPFVVLGIYYGLVSRGFLRYGYWGASAFLCYLIMATVSRGAILASLVGLGVFFYWMVRLRWVKWWLILFVLVPIVLYGALSDTRFVYRLLLLLASMEWTSHAPFLVDLFHSYGVTVRADPHLVSVSSTLRHAEIHPILGIGYTGMHLGAEGSDTPELNRYLAILGSTGLASAVPYVVFVISLMWISRKAIVRLYRDHRPGVELGIILLTCTSMFAIKLNNEGQESLYYWVFFALTAAWIRNSRRFIGLARAKSRHPPGKRGRAAWRGETSILASSGNSVGNRAELHSPPP